MTDTCSLCDIFYSSTHYRLHFPILDPLHQGNHVETYSRKVPLVWILCHFYINILVTIVMA